jgi:hypothetical protein
LDFAERDKCKLVLLRLSLAGNLEKTTYVPLWDRMEGAWLGALAPPFPSIDAPIVTESRPADVEN